MTDKELKRYVCGWCRNEFTQSVGEYGAGGKHSTVTDQVKCPHCLNFIKT